MNFNVLKWIIILCHSLQYSKSHTPVVSTVKNVQYQRQTVNFQEHSPTQQDFRTMK